MTTNWNLLVPTLVVAAAAAAQIVTTLRERRTGEVVWWAKLPVFPRPDYSDPAKFQMRQTLNVVGSIAWVLIASFVTLKFVGL